MSELSADTNGGDGEISDRELVALAQKGKYTAFDQLVIRHRGKQYAMIYSMINNEADAWDLTQDSFIKAWKALPKFENRSKFSTWLFRISHNVVYDWKRKKKIQAEGELNDEILTEVQLSPQSKTTPSIAIRPDLEMERNELAAEIEAALGTLSEKHKEIIILREVQGMDYKEIAALLDCSLGTVMSRLFNARKKLQQLLKK